MSEKKKEKSEPAYVIIRIGHASPIEPAPEIEGLPSGHFDLTRGCVINFTPIRVVWSRDLALSEVDRLNSLNASKGVLYFFSHTRVESRASLDE